MQESIFTVHLACCTLYPQKVSFASDWWWYLSLMWSHQLPSWKPCLGPEADQLTASVLRWGRAVYAMWNLTVYWSAAGAFQLVPPKDSLADMLELGLAPRLLLSWTLFWGDRSFCHLVSVMFLWIFAPVLSLDVCRVTCWILHSASNSTSHFVNFPSWICSFGSVWSRVLFIWVLHFYSSH